MGWKKSYLAIPMDQICTNRSRGSLQAQFQALELSFAGNTLPIPHQLDENEIPEAMKPLPLSQSTKFSTPRVKRNRTETE